MKRLSLILLLVGLSFVLVTPGQFAKKELETLRQEAGLPNDEIIRADKSVKFPANKSLKMFLAINQSETDAEKFEKWVKKWNKKNSKQHGVIVLVAKPKDADVIVAQYRTVRPKYVTESKISVGNLNKKGKVLDKTRVKSEYGYKRLDLPTHSYLLTRHNGLWTVVFSNIESVFVEEQFVNPHARLRGALNRRLKKR